MNFGVACSYLATSADKATCSYQATYPDKATCSYPIARSVFLSCFLLSFSFSEYRYLAKQPRYLILAPWRGRDNTYSLQHLLAHAPGGYWHLQACYQAGAQALLKIAQPLLSIAQLLFRRVYPLLMQLASLKAAEALLRQTNKESLSLTPRCYGLSDGAYRLHCELRFAQPTLASSQFGSQFGL